MVSPFMGTLICPNPVPSVRIQLQQQSLSLAWVEFAGSHQASATPGTDKHKKTYRVVPLSSKSVYKPYWLVYSYL